MKGLIHKLSDDLINKIAAGEVIQRPSSVLKELIENSIDANAKNINVIVKDFGKSLIEISDDGDAHHEIHDLYDFCKASIYLPSYELQCN